MPRQSLVHYIAPSAISITPNCNGSASDLAVYMARDTKIKVYSEAAKIGMATTNTYQEWTLAGRNRRLADSSCPYTIYARLPKYDKTKGYLVFVKQQQVGNVWKDKYPYIIKDGDGLYHDVYGTESNEYYYIRMGEVSLPAEGKREVNLDTGILGTDQYNEDWNLNPDNLPMRVELNCIINDEDAGPTPYVYWGETLQLVASLIKGWSDYSSPRLDHWEITRDSGNATADAAWPGSARAAQFASTGIINLSHSRNADDFNGAVNATFTVNAWGYPDSDSSGTPQLQILESASICIMAETVEKYELMLSTEIVSYNPQTQEYSPEGGVKVNVRATDQRGDVFDMSTAQITTIRLAASYALVDDSTWTALTFSDVSGIGTATIPISFFANQQSVNIRLLNSENKEVARKTIAFVRDGEDSKEREWIFLRSATPIVFGDASSDHPKPSLISGGEVNPTGAAGGEDTNKNQDGWVPEGWWDEQRGTEEDYPYEYGSYRNFIHASASDSSDSGDSPDGHWGDFTDPTIWSHFGKDGNGIVSITKTYAISAQATTANDNTAPSDITAWSAGSPATTPAKPYLWVKEVTVYTDTTKNTTKYYRIGSRGDNGIDAQDVEWVYIRTKTTTAPVISSDSAYTDHNGHPYADDDHLPRVVAEAGNTDIESNNSGDAEHPFECTDNPKGTDDTWKYEWEIKRTKGNANSTTHKRSWNAYTGTMILRTDPAFNRYINTILGGATGNATTVATAQNAVLSALNSRIYQQGGLMLASLIAMRKLKQGGDPDQLSGYDTWGGISGQYDGDARGYGIAAWYGGDMIDYETLTDAEKAAGWGSGTGQQRWARSLFRFDGSGYLSNGNISWDAAGNATFKGSISTSSTVGGSDWQTFIRSKQITYDSAIQNLQEQIDGSIETVYGDVDPTEEGNDPYADYTTAEKIKHLGDNYYNTVSGYAYRYTTSVDPETSEDLYYWTLITDSGITDAIAKAGEALNVANTKGKIFSTTNNTLPSPPYNLNDIWVNATGEWLEGGQTYKYTNEIMKCTTARTAANTQKITDWQVANGYTAGINTAKGLAEAAQGNLDGLVAQILNGTGASGDSYITAGSALHVIKDALVDGSSFQSGGLFMTNFIAMRDPSDNNTVWGGLSGVYNPKDETQTGGEKGHGIAAWYGGANVDIEALTGTAKTTYDNLTPDQRKNSSAYAKTLFRFDGSGYVAGTNISWNAAGDVTIKGKTFKATTSIDTPAIYLNGTDITTALNNLLDMFEKDTTTVSGQTLIKAKYSLYSLGGLSALGSGSGGGGGGGGQGDVTWEALASGDNNNQIASSHITGLLGGTFTGKNYAVQRNNNGKLYVSVPWPDITLAGLMGDTAIGGTTQPIYWNGTAFANTTYTLGKSVPSDAVFTDHYAWSDITDKPLTLTKNTTGFSISGGTTSKTLTVGADYTLGAACAKGVTDNTSATAVTSTDTNLITGRTLYYAGYVKSSGVTKVSTGTGLTGGDITTTGTVSINSTYQTYISHGESAYNSLSDYLQLAGGTMTGVLTLKGEQYDGYKTGSNRTYGMNANNSDIIGVNSIIMNDKSDSWSESIGFPRDGSDAGHYDTFRAANGVFYFGFNGYYDSSNSAHAAAEVITMDGGTIKLERGDTNTASVRMKNTSRDISLDAGSTNCGVYYNTGSKWLIGTDGTNSWLNTGNVGIGTTSPSAKLEVSGTVKATGGYLISSRSYTPAQGADPVTNTVTIGSQNYSWCHIYNSLDIPFIFNKDVYSMGGFFPYTTNANNLGSTSNRWNTAYINYIYGKDSKVGINTTSPNYALHVGGDIYATGGVTCLSDINKKDVIDYDLPLTVEQIAEAPVIRFTWKDKRDEGEQVGTVAQYWEKVLPQVTKKKNDELGMQYGVTALVGLVKTTRKVVDHEILLQEQARKIEAQDKEIRELREELSKLKTA